MDFIKRFDFIRKPKDNTTQNSSLLGRKKSKKPIFSHNNNDRLVSSKLKNSKTEDDENEDDQEDEDDQDYNHRTMPFGQRPLHAITITRVSTKQHRPTKSKDMRPTHQLYMHHQNSPQAQLLPLSTASNNMQQCRQSSVAFEKRSESRDCYEKGKYLAEQTHHHYIQEKMAVRNSEKMLFNSNNKSTLYAPFIERPEIRETGYIPLPTVTRKYIDPPPDVLLNSIPSFHIHKKNHIIPLDNSANPSLLPTTTATMDPPKKPRAKLVVDTQRLDNSSIPDDIDMWLSKNVAMAANGIDV